jgi:transcriptional activator for dhaKLM operon
MNEVNEFSQTHFAWTEFTRNNRILPNITHNIANSWRRCRGRSGSEKPVIPRHVSDDHLLAFQVASFDLISIARPVIEDIYQFIEGSGVVVVFVDGAATILDYCGDEDAIAFINQFGFTRGTLVSEAEIGTNAFGLALIDRFPSKVVGAEHYFLRFHPLAESAAPVFDLSGRPLGVLGIIMKAENHSPHTLGMVVAGSRAIEGQIQSEHLLTEQNNRLAELNAVLSANSQAVLVWDSERVLMHMNPAAADLLGVSPDALLGRHIREFISYPDFIREAVEKKEPLTDVEINVDVNGRTISCVISMRYVIRGNDIQWIIINARPGKEVHKLVQNQVGAHAALTLADLPGESIQMKRVRRFVKKAAGAEVCIFISGETGTGKNPVASAIHNESPRKDRPFMIYACSSIPSEILVQELLGFDEGISEKMPGGRPSKFELADNGTMYFQDVESLPLEAQGVLLNVIDLGIVQRLGSKRPIEVDVRVVAAASKDIKDLIAQGNFRADLFYRLNSLEIRLPALRERTADLPLLLDRIIGRLAKQMNRKLRYDPEIVDVLGKYSWPGNLRELEAVLGRAAVHAGFSGRISINHLPEYVRFPKRYSKISGDTNRIKTMEEIERENILNAAKLCNGNASEIARHLGIGRTTLWRKLKKSNIQLQDFKNLD